MNYSWSVRWCSSIVTRLVLVRVELPRSIWLVAVPEWYSLMGGDLLEWSALKAKIVPPTTPQWMAARRLRKTAIGFSLTIVVVIVLYIHILSVTGAISCSLDVMEWEMIHSIVLFKVPNIRNCSLCVGGEMICKTKHQNRGPRPERQHDTQIISPFGIVVSCIQIPNDVWLLTAHMQQWISS